MILIKFNFHIIRSVAFIEDVTSAGGRFQNRGVKGYIAEVFPVKFILNKNTLCKQLPCQNQI